MEFTTNYFQCFDLRLTNGSNTITLQVADLAGNTTSTNLTFTLDGSGDTNPPAISLVWPQSGRTLSGDAFTVNGFLDDPSATVTVSLVGTNGGTNLFNGLVGRSGEFWVENLPLSGGTNQLYLTATDFWGNSAMTNVTVIKAGFDLTVDALTPEQLAEFTATVTGTISSTNQDVWVNGILATVSNGVWQAENVPISHQPTVMLRVKSVPTGSDPNTTASTAEANLVQDAPPLVEVTSYHEQAATDGYHGGIYYSIGSRRIDWGEGVGGSFHNHVRTELVGFGLLFDCTTTATLPETIWEANTPLMASDSCAGATTIALPLSAKLETIAATITSGQIDAQTALKTNGKDVPGEVNTYLVKVQAQDQFGSPYAPRDVLVQGGALTPSPTNATVGEVLVQAPSGATLGFTPQVTSAANYSWSGQAIPVKPFILANGFDLSTNTPEFCVGQKVTFELKFSSPINYVNAQSLWILPDEYVNESYQSGGTSGSVNYRVNLNLLTNLATSCWFVNSTGGTVRVGTSLQLSNGQFAVFTARGKFTVVRPTVVGTNWSVSGVNMFTNANGSLRELTFSDATGHNMEWSINVQRPDNFAGSGWHTQVINRNVSYNTHYLGLTVSHTDTTGGTNWLDTEIQYGASFGMVRTFPLNDPPVRTVSFFDGPSLSEGNNPFSDRAEIKDDFHAFLRFKPDGTNNIPITLGRVDWGWHAKAVNTNGVWSLVISTNYGPFFDWSERKFPYWQKIYQNY